MKLERSNTAQYLTGRMHSLRRGKEISIFISMRVMFYLMLAGLVGCNLTETNHKPKTDITRICFASGGCFGTCPVLAIEIDSSLAYTYYGSTFAEPQGYHTGYITSGFWDTLTRQLEGVNYKNLDSTYNNTVDDLSIGVVIYYPGGEKRLHAQQSDLPDSVWLVFEDIYDSYRNVKLIPAVDTLTALERRFYLYEVLSAPPPPPAPSVKEHDN